MQRGLDLLPGGRAVLRLAVQPDQAGLPVFVAELLQPGPPLPPSPTLKNVLIIGDSVSIGYTSYASPNVPELLSDVALVQPGRGT